MANMRLVFLGRKITQIYQIIILYQKDAYTAFLKKFQLNPDLLKAYSEVFIDYLKRDYIEEIGPSTPVHPEGKLHYLPHSGVLKKSNTTALRVVFDASSTSPS